MAILKLSEVFLGPHKLSPSRQPIARLLSVWGAFAVILAGMALPAAAQTEYDLKAVFLCRFAQYVEWPSAAFEDASTPITIGILGDDPFGKTIEEATAGETPQNRKIVIKRSSHIEDLSGCHILFISRSEKARLSQVLKNLEGKGTLTVADTEQFARQGGMINFTSQGGKVQFEINNKAAKMVGLKISAQLLRLAKVVE